MVSNYIYDYSVFFPSASVLPLLLLCLCECRCTLYERNHGIIDNFIRIFFIQQRKSEKIPSPNRPLKLKEFWSAHESRSLLPKNTKIDIRSDERITSINNEDGSSHLNGTWYAQHSLGTINVRGIKIEDENRWSHHSSSSAVIIKPFVVTEVNKKISLSSPRLSPSAIRSHIWPDEGKYDGRMVELRFLRLSWWMDSD